MGKSYRAIFRAGACALAVGAMAGVAHADSLADAIRLAYHTNPSLQQQRAQLRQDAARTGLKGEIGSRTVQGVARDMVAIAKSGLRRRAKLNANGNDETGFLTELEEIADSGVTPAERLLELYHGPWQGDASRAYDDLAY